MGPVQREPSEALKFGAAADAREFGKRTRGDRITFLGKKLRGLSPPQAPVLIGVHLSSQSSAGNTAQCQDHPLIGKTRRLIRAEYQVRRLKTLSGGFPATLFEAIVNPRHELLHFTDGGLLTIGVLEPLRDMLHRFSLRLRQSVG
jgi:hypothetical protein